MSRKSLSIFSCLRKTVFDCLERFSNLLNIFLTFFELFSSFIHAFFKLFSNFFLDLIYFDLSTIPQCCSFSEEGLLNDFIRKVRMTTNRERVKGICVTSFMNYPQISFRTKLNILCRIVE